MEDGTATMFLTAMKRDGIIHERQLDSLDSCFTGGHGQLRFDNLRIPASDVLGEIGKGFRYAQVRLAPARLTHCMRWLGAARRAHDIACDYARTRDAFGKPLGEHQGVGRRANVDSSMAKVISAEALWRVVDRCVQVLGGRGVTGDTVVERIFRDIRPFRIYDGPSEVHRMSLAKKLLDQRLEAR